MEKINTDYKQWFNKMRQSWHSFDQWNTQVHDDKQHTCTDSLKFAIQSAKVECTWIPVSVEQHKIHAVTTNLRYVVVVWFQ